eukprot:5359462-Prymnesium_polylepis.1
MRSGEHGGRCNSFCVVCPGVACAGSQRLGGRQVPLCDRIDTLRYQAQLTHLPVASATANSLTWPNVVQCKRRLWQAALPGSDDAHVGLATKPFLQSPFVASGAPSRPGSLVS